MPGRGESSIGKWVQSEYVPIEDLGNRSRQEGTQWPHLIPGSRGLDSGPERGGRGEGQMA